MLLGYKTTQTINSKRRGEPSDWFGGQSSLILPTWIAHCEWLWWWWLVVVGCCFLEFYILTTFKVISKWASTCHGAHAWGLFSTTPLGDQTVSVMTCYPTQAHYPDTEPTSPCPILIMPSIWLGRDQNQFWSHWFGSAMVQIGCCWWWWLVVGGRECRWFRVRQTRSWTGMMMRCKMWQ